VKLSIPEAQIGKLRLRQTALIRLDSRPGEEFAGTVYSVGSKSDMPSQHTYPVEVIVANRGPQTLKVGMFVRVDLRVNNAERALTISKESLLNEDASPSVFVVDEKIARLRPVKLGVRAGDRYQVLDGLHEGDLVISFGQKGVKDGSPVQYK
jgi:HlyD family secretion protein